MSLQKINDWFFITLKARPIYSEQWDPPTTNFRKHILLDRKICAGIDEREKSTKEN